MRQYNKTLYIRSEDDYKDSGTIGVTVIIGIALLTFVLLPLIAVILIGIGGIM